METSQLEGQKSGKPHIYNARLHLLVSTAAAARPDENNHSELCSVLLRREERQAGSGAAGSGYSPNDLYGDDEDYGGMKVGVASHCLHFLRHRFSYLG